MERFLSLSSAYLRRGDIVHGRMRIDAKDVMARLFLEDARRAADIEDGELLEFFGDRRDGEATAGRHVPDDHVDMVALDEVADIG